MQLHTPQVVAAYDLSGERFLTELTLESSSKPDTYRFTIRGGQRRALWDIWFRGQSFLIRNTQGVFMRVNVASFPYQSDSHGYLRLETRQPTAP